jgi:sugar phosphate isomerase/epimerase
MPAEGAPRDSGVGSAIELLGPRIAQVHLHDNHGAFAHNIDMKDEHLWPGNGSIDWPAVMSALAALPAATPGLLEVAVDRDESAEAVTSKVVAAFRNLENQQFTHLS